jgi:hypothetical protein
MTLYAHVVGSTVDTVSSLPALYFDGTVWHDWRGDPPWRTQPSSAGWFPIMLTPRPADDATTTHDESVKIVSGLPVQTWTPRPWTVDELAARTAAANAATIQADTTADLANLTQAIADLAILLEGDATVGSIRNLMGPSGAAAGTGNLRALAAQSNTAVINAASIKALIRVNIDLAQLSINDVQATRRVARQVLRLAKALVGDYSSADVGMPK